MILTRHKITQINLANVPEHDLDVALAQALIKLPVADRSTIEQAVGILSDEIDGVGVKIALEILGRIALLITQEETNNGRIF